jgi:tRNA(Ile)-lysidine synthase
VTATARIPKRGNLEQNARNARYAFLAKTAAATQAKMVLTGHTMNDQAETFLLNLIRGSGPDGLSAMSAVRFMDESGVSHASDIGPLLVRPLLRWAKRLDTEAFCRDLSVGFRCDEMNDDPKYSRVKVRKCVIPLLEEFNPRVIDTLCSTAERIKDLVPVATNEVLADRLPISQVAELPGPEMSRLIRSWLSAKRGTLRGIEAKHIEAVKRLVLSRKSGRTVELPGRQSVSKRGGGLVFEAIMVEK